MPDHDDQLRRISAALDGEGPLPQDLDPEGRAFLAAATRLRARVRIEEAATPPDVTEAVLAQVTTERSERPSQDEGPPAIRSQGRKLVEDRRGPRATALAAAAVFAAAALVTVALVRPNGPLGPGSARADVGAEVLAAQHRVTGLDATLHLVERGAHPDAPLRRYDGTLRYRAPERLWLRLEERTTAPAGFPANDLELVVDEARAWTTGLQGCPVGAQPACLGSPGSRVTAGLPPFAPDLVAPLDLVVPTGAFLPGAAVAATRNGDEVTVEATVARFQRTIDGLRAAGALRDVHPTDAVELVLDRDSSTIRRLAVRAGDSAARQAWAASNGYAETPGTVVLDLTVTEGRPTADPFPTPPVPPRADAGFIAGISPAHREPDPSWLPDGYGPGRQGTRPGGDGALIAVRSWTDGRGWIRVDAVAGWEGPEVFGRLGPLVRRIPVGDGVGYVDPEGSTVALHGDGLDLAVTGSVPLDVLVRVAASLPTSGRPLPDTWPQGRTLDDLPAGALRPPGPVVARYDGPHLVVAVPGPGQTSAVLRQRPGSSLGLPADAGIVEVQVRGVLGRHDPRTGTVAWLEGGWMRELRSTGLSLADLLAAADHLEAT